MPVVSLLEGGHRERNSALRVFSGHGDHMTEQELSRRAKRRLAIIPHAQEVTGNVALTCRHYGISRQCYYQWYRRYQAQGLQGLRDRSKRPLVSPNATHTEVAKIVYLRQHYHFGPAKISMYLKRYRDIQISHTGVWRILKRLDLSRLPASRATSATTSAGSATRSLGVGWLRRSRWAAGGWWNARMPG
jgi:transposase